MTALTESAAPPRASPSSLRHQDAVELGRLGELLGNVDRVLAGHRVNGKQHVVGLGRLLDPHELVHQRRVDMEAARGVDDQHVEALRLRLTEGPFGDVDRVALDALREDLDAGLLAELLQLVDGRRSLRVAGGDGDALLLALQVLGELRRGGRLARPLQARHQDHGRPLGGEDQVTAGAAHQLGQLLVNHLDDHLARFQALEHALPDRRLANAGDELLGDLEVDVRLEQGEADLAHRLVDVVGAQLAA